jgi:CubicO group peptidase (beta-lactamase class C family)
MIKEITKTVLCFMCFFVAAYAQDGTAVSDELEKTAVQEMKRSGTPGVAIAVVKDGRVVFAKAFGFSNLEAQTSMTTDTLCRSGPITSVFTAAALVMLQEQGKLKLDQPVGKYINGLSPKLAAVNAHQLLSHTAGLKEEHPNYGLLDESALSRTVRSWKDDYSLSPPGQIYSHSNPGYVLAGLLIEELSKKPFANVLSELLFEPLGMSRTTFRPSLVMTYPFSQSYRSFSGEKLAQVRPFALDAFGWPSGSMFSNVNDLARFTIAFMNGGKIEDKQVLSSSLIDALSTPVVAVPGLNDQKSTYGLLAEDYRGVHVLSISGSWAGYTEQMWMAPKHRFAFIVMANRNQAFFNATIQKAMELMLPLEPAPPKTLTQALPMSDEEMSSYLGTYSNENTVEIVLKDHQLFLREGKSELPVRKLRDQVFSAGSPGMSQSQTFALVTGASGRIEFLHRAGRALRRTPIPQTAQ